MATILTTDPLWYFSPWNWTSENAAGVMGVNNVKAGSAHARTAHSGAYFKLSVQVTGTSGPITMTINPARLAGGESISLYREWDNGGAANFLITNASSATITLTSSLAAGRHDMLFWTDAVTASDRWTTPTCAIEILSVDLPAGVVLVQPVLLAKTMLIFGDSLVDAGISTWAQHVAAGMLCEVGVVGFGGQGYNDPQGSVPEFRLTWDKYDATQSRLVSGLFAPAPDYVVVAQGQNDANNGTTTGFVASTLAGVAAAATRSRLICSIPFSGNARSAILAGIPSPFAIVDADPSQLKTLRSWFTTDSIHPNGAGTGVMAAAFMSKMRDVLGSFGSFGAGRIGP